MNRLLTEFTSDQLAVFAVNDGEPLDAVADYVQDSGATFPILMDNPEAFPACWRLNAEDETTAQHFRNRVGQDLDGPFPLQIVIGADRKLVYMARNHVPEALFEAVTQAVADSAGIPRPDLATVAEPAEESGSCTASPKPAPWAPVLLLVLLVSLLGPASHRRRAAHR
ncbi:MAG: MYXO-CTERM domain-containing protein [Myxococcota bacterium]|jgi:MYXO-CTERM domain-containing protein